MKKLALALVASTVALGAANANITTGFYLGLHGGFGANTAKISQQTGGQAASGNQDAGSTAANIGLHGGYGWVQSCMYYGGEVGYTFENAKIRDSLGVPNSGSAQLKRNGYFRVALRGGYLFTPNTMLYIALGINWGKWTLNDSGSNPGFTTTNVGTGSKNRLSFAPGVGLETAVHKNVYLRVEYNYEFGPSVRATNSSVANTFSQYGTIRSQSGKIGLSYKF